MTIRVVATMVVRDEVDIVAATLDHLFFQGASHVIVTDNGSRDGTRQVLSWYSQHREVSVIDEPVGAFWQSRWVTRMARRSAEQHGADWVVHVDADEFLLHPTMRYPELFASVDDAGDIVTIPRLDYVAVEGVVGDVAPLLQRVRKFESLNPQGAPLLPKVAHRADAAATVAAGNHGVEGPSLHRVVQVPDLVIHHFPARSMEQVRRKITNLSDGHRASRLIEQGVGTTAVGRRHMIDEGTFDSEYSSVYGRSPSQVEAGLADGSLVSDTLVSEAVASARAESVQEGEFGFGDGSRAWLGLASTRAAAEQAPDVLAEVDDQQRRLLVVFQMRAKEVVRSVREVVDGPVVLFDGVEVAQLYPEPWRRDVVEIDMVVADVGVVDAQLRGAGFSTVGPASGVPEHPPRYSRLVRGDDPVAVHLHGRGGSPWPRKVPFDEIIARARPSRTGLDGVMRPRDDHHALLLAARHRAAVDRQVHVRVDLGLLRQRSQ